MRVTAHFENGLVAPEGLAEREHLDAVRAGRLSFLYGCAWAATAARSAAHGALADMITAPDTEKTRRREQAAIWITVMHVVNKLALDEAARLAAPMPTVATPSADAWGTFMALAGWRLQEGDTVRASSLEEFNWDERPQEEVDISVAQTTTPADIAAAMAAFTTVRTTNKGKDAPEAKDPLRALAKRVGGCQPTTDIAAFVRGTSADLADVLRLPPDTLIAITLSLLLRVRDDMRISVKRLDNFEAWLRGQVKLVHRAALADGANAWTDDERAAFAAAARPALLNGLILDAATAFVALAPRADEIRQAMNVPELSTADIVLVAKAAATDAFAETAHQHIVAPCVDALASALAAVGVEPAAVERYSKRLRHSSRDQDRARSLLNGLLGAAPAATVTDACTRLDNADWLGALSRALVAVPGPFAERLYDVALPLLDHRITAHEAGVATDPAASLVSLGDVFDRWAPSGAQMSRPPESERPTACFLVHGIRARNADDAEALARVKAEGDLHLLWFIGRFKFPVELDTTKGFRRSCRS